VRSVANLTRADGEAFLALAPTVPVRTLLTRYPPEAADEALADLRAGALTGAARRHALTRKHGSASPSS
jgi:alcohol dehydrogenase, propanol-preferring